MLGSIEAMEKDGPSPQLNGMNQRAVLGYLLLHANKVVPTSRIVWALWGENVPATSRKMVQNAVSGLRRMLAAEGAGGAGGADEAGAGCPAEIVTCPPGYLLRVDPEAVDLTRFRRLVARGRADSAAGASASAAEALRAALGLWRGSALADLAECGVDWPELAMLHDERKAAQEDLVEAELALGRHHEVVGELAALAEAEPARERLCGQLMVALYRCSRQSEALAAYRRTRESLVGAYGLDPSRDLQALERAILVQDPALSPAAPAAVPAAAPALSVVRAVPVAPVVASASAAGSVAEGVVDVAGAGGRSAEAARAVTAPEPARPEVRPEPVRSQARPEVRPEPTRPQARPESAAEKPVRRAPVVERSAAVRTLGGKAAGQGDFVQFTEGRFAEGRFTEGRFTEGQPAETGREHDPELARLRAEQQDVLLRRRPRLVTVIGEPGAGKSRLVAELAGGAVESREDRTSGQPRRLTVDAGRPGAASPFGALLRAVVGLPESASRAEAELGLAGLVAELAGNGAWAQWLVSQLSPWLGAGPVAERAVSRRAASFACWQVLGMFAAEHPLTIVLEDLHRGDDALLDLVQGLADHAGPVPLLILVTARPELLRRRSSWGDGGSGTTIIRLPPAVERAPVVPVGLPLVALPSIGQRSCPMVEFETAAVAVGARSGRSAGSSAQPERAVPALARYEKAATFRRPAAPVAGRAEESGARRVLEQVAMVPAAGREGGQLPCPGPRRPVP